MSRAWRRLQQRTLGQAVYDAACWTAAVFVATVLRYDLDLGSYRLRGLPILIAVVVLAQVLAGLLFGLYRGRWRFGSFDEVAALARTTLAASLTGFLVNLPFDPQLAPRSVPLGAGLVALVLMAGGRYIRRLDHERRRRPQSPNCRRLLIVGAGEGGAQVIKALLGNPESPYLPVGLLDDDPRKRNLRIMGVPVVGTRDTMATAAVDLRADDLLIAIPTADGTLLAEITEQAIACGLPVKVLPRVSELIGCRVGASDIRDIDPADLLGRHEIQTDVDSIAGYLTGKRVLITGAGGSIGSELCRQIYRFAPSELIMLDRDESALHAVQLSISGRALLDSPDLVLMDLRDHAAVHDVLRRRRPHVVFHAAALKHLPLLERHPAEAVKTNVWATLNLLEASVAAGVGRFVNISTDKAADPCSVLGYTKRITERLTAHMAGEGETVCLSVRFGNVLGSRGSVLTTFHSQIERGGPLTVTHPDVTRYFMTVEEAVELLIQAGAIGRAGEVLVLDMGEPVRIDEVARLLASRAPRQVTIHYTGLRMGEKLHEVRLGEDETDRRIEHPLISHVTVQALDPALVRDFDVAALTDADVVERLAHLCGRDVALRSQD